MVALLKRPRSALREFLASEAAGGVLLMGAAFFALILANGPLANEYFALLEAKAGGWPLHHWINDGLMALFFLLVGLEIKRELTDGHLANWQDRALPALAAAGGMLLPALVFLAVAGGVPGLARGWAIPAATDIAFAIAVLSLLGRRVPASLKLFLTTVAIVDDMGAVAIIAIAYTPTISGPWLLASLAVTGAMLGLNRLGVAKMRWYLLGFALLWFAVLQSGVHATVAGVIAALTVPVRPTPAAPDAEDSTLHRMEHLLQRPVAWAIVPLFGFANAGVALSNVDWVAPLTLAVALGLFLGKQVGVLGAVWIAVRSGFAPHPAQASWTQIYGVALLCGIGFTMSLFIGGLAFADLTHLNQAKIGVVLGSLLSAICGFIVLRFAARP